MALRLRRALTELKVTSNILIFVKGGVEIAKAKSVKVKKISIDKIIELMKSEDYKDRFKAEYYQLYDKHNKLSEMLEKYKAGTLDFFPKCNLYLLGRQKRCMTEYLHILEKRAELEKIKL